MSVRLSVCLLLFLSVAYVSVANQASQPASQSVCLSVYLSVALSLSLYEHLSSSTTPEVNNTCNQSRRNDSEIKIHCYANLASHLALEYYSKSFHYITSCFICSPKPFAN